MRLALTKFIPYSLKFLRVKNFEDFKDFCVALKILLSKILVLQRRLLKLISNLWFKLIIIKLIGMKGKTKPYKTNL